MTVGVVVDTFAMIKAENDGILLMTDDQGEWVRSQRMLLAKRPLKAMRQPKQAWRLSIYELVTSNRFELCIMVVILANTAQMATDWWEPHPDARSYFPDLKVRSRHDHARALPIQPPTPPRDGPLPPLALAPAPRSRWPLPPARAAPRSRCPPLALAPGPRSRWPASHPPRDGCTQSSPALPASPLSVRSRQ